MKNSQNFELEPKTINELVNLLQPFLEDERGRLPFLNLALGTNAPVLKHINWSGSVAIFIPHLLDKLAKIGREQVFRQFLEYARDFVGIDQKQRIENVLDLIDSPSSEESSSNPIPPSEGSATKYYEYLEEADTILIDQFVGRAEDLEQLNKFIIDNPYRVVTLVGMAGMGKSCLAKKFTETKEVKDKFQYVIWKNLRITDSFEEFLNQVINLLSVNTNDLSVTSTDRIQVLINYLKENQCLLVLDDLTEILDKNSTGIKYKKGWKKLGRFLEEAAIQNHKSTILITCHDYPRLDAQQIKNNTKIIEVKGLNVSDIQQIFPRLNLPFNFEDCWESFVEHYGGNPGLLEIVVERILEEYDGDICRFLEHNADYRYGIPINIKDILNYHFKRLQPSEQELMYRLAIENEAVPIEKIKFLPFSYPISLFNSLRIKSFIKLTPAVYTPIPMVVDYVTEKIVEQVVTEIINKNPQILHKYPLLDSQAKDYIKEIQKRRILQPIIDKLLENENMGGKVPIKENLFSMLDIWRDKQPTKGYLAGNIINLLLELEIDLKNSDFSHIPLGKADLQGKELHGFNFSNSDLSEANFYESISSIHSVAFSADGQYFATAEANGNVRLWQTDTYKQVKLFRDEKNSSQIWSIAFSPDGKMLASAGEDKILRLWDVETGDKIDEIKDNQCIYSVAFSHKGRFLLTGGDERIAIWNLNPLDFKAEIPFRQVNSIAISRCNILAIGCQDGLVALLNIEDINSPQILHTFRENHTTKIRCIAFNHDDTTLASGSEDGSIQVWKRDPDQSFKFFKTLRDTEMKQVWTISFSQNGKILASGSRDANPVGIDKHHNIRLWDLNDGKLQQKINAHHHQLRAVAFYPQAEQSNLLISGGDDHTIKIWDTSNKGKLQKTIQGYTNRIWSVVFSPCGTKLVSGCEDNKIYIWNVQTKQCIKILQKHTDWVWSVAFSPDGKKIASASQDNTICLWHLKNDQWVYDSVLEKHTDRVRVVAFSPDGNKLVSGGNDHPVILWDLTKSKASAKILGESCEQHTNRILSIAFSPDGNWIASSSRDKTIRLWNLETGKGKILGSHDNQVHSIAFSPDGEILVSGGFDNKVKLWDLKEQKCIGTFEEHKDRILCVAFHPNGLIFASSGHDKQIRLWSRIEQKCIGVLEAEEGHKAAIESINFSPTGEILVSSSQDQTIKIWDIYTGKCLDTLQPDSKPYEGMRISGARGLSEGQKDTLMALGARDE